MSKKVAVIGGGAAGFFFAINLAMRTKDAEIVILEKTNKVLSKVKVSGGGRCNVTNATYHNGKLSYNYPRGQAFLRKVFEDFSAKDTVDWFSNQHVTLKAEDDNRIFPLSDSSQTIIECFMQAIERLGVKLRTSTVVDSIKKLENGKLQLNENEEFDFVFIGTGGSAKLESYNWLANLGHTILTPLPSLFTLNIPDNPLKGLEGLSVVEASVRAEKTNLSATGGWLVTHWGISGPAVLRLSAWGAKELAERNYHFAVFVNFITQMNAEVVRTKMQEFGQLNKQKLIGSHRLFDLPSRLWERMVFLAEIHPELRWCDISKQKLNKLVENLTNFRLEVRGKTTFKEEFVTCGGVSLDDVHVQTIESKIVRGLFFGGEVLDIDGITGGFNFQAAWSTAWLAAKEVARRIED